MNIDVELVDLEGDPIAMEEGGPPATLRQVAIPALLALFNGEHVTGDVKAKRYALALKLHTADGECELTPEDTTEIKNVVGMMYQPLIVGQVWKLLNK